MRKARKKRIVAMTLALSMLASSAGTCASAAAGTTEDGSGLEVTLVPLSSDTQAQESDSNDPSNQNPKVPAGETEQPEGDTSEGETSSDKPGIERPEQSDTVETLPGTAEDNKEHIKGEDGTETPDAPEMPGEGTGEGTGDSTGEGAGGGTGDSTGEGAGGTTGDTEQGKDTNPPPDGGKDTAAGDLTDKSGKTEGVPETDKPSEGGDEKEPEAEETDNLDYSLAYDTKTGHFKVTFNIKEDAEGDQTVELSKVQEVVNKYGKGYLDTDLGKKQLEKAKVYGDETMKYTYNGVDYVYDLTTGEVRMRNEPGCTTVFDVSLSNGSKHTYVYKNDSFTVATPDMKNDDQTGVTGFDGQELPKDYVRNDLQLGYSKDPNISGCLEELVDKAIDKNIPATTKNYYLDSNGELTKDVTKVTVPAGTEVVKIGNKYYVQTEDGYYYGGTNIYNKGFSSSDVTSTKNPDGTFTYTLKKDKTNVPTAAYQKSGSSVKGVSYEYKYTRSDALTQREVQKAVSQYLSSNGYSTYDAYILDYYNKKDGTQYENVQELLRSNSKASADLYHGGAGDLNTRLTTSPDQFYNNFYQNILSFKVGDPDKVDSEASGNEDHGHSHGSWASDGTQETIGDYMVGKLNETGSWEKANEYFQTLRLSGMSDEEATWAAFAMATNIDFKNAGNDYQNTAWSWYASMVLHQADGTLDLTKVDKEGNVIGDDEGEGQTSFYLWKYETETDDSGKETEVPMYCTYVEPTYSTNDAGEQVLEKEGFYCWVKYDPAEDKLNYTITTTNGSLNIDYTLLENVVYYLQEALAPEGYDADPNIYVICDEDTYNEMVSSGAFDNVENPAGNTSGPVAGWLGSIIGGETLTLNFVNAKSAPTPSPDPEPDPDIPPVNPDTPVDPENPDLPPVQDAHAEEETPVLPQNPENPAVQDARADTLPQTGTTGWLAAALMSFGSALMACGWFFTRRQHAPKH